MAHPNQTLEFTKQCFVQVLGSAILFQRLKEFCVKDFSVENIIFYSGFLELEQAIRESVSDYYTGLSENATTWVAQRFLRGVKAHGQQKLHNASSELDLASRPSRAEVSASLSRRTGRRRSNARSLSPVRHPQDVYAAISEVLGDSLVGEVETRRKSMYVLQNPSYTKRMEMTDTMMDLLTIRTLASRDNTLPRRPEPQQVTTLGRKGTSGITPAVAVPEHIIPHFLYFYACFLDDDAMAAGINIPGNLRVDIKQHILEHLGTAESGGGSSPGRSARRSVRRNQRKPLLSTVFDHAIDHIVEMLFFDVFRRFVPVYNKESEERERLSDDRQSSRSGSSFNRMFGVTNRVAKDLVAGATALAKKSADVFTAPEGGVFKVRPPSSAGFTEDMDSRDQPPTPTTPRFPRLVPPTSFVQRSPSQSSDTQSRTTTPVPSSPTRTTHRRNKSSGSASDFWGKLRALGSVDISNLDDEQWGETVHSSPQRDSRKQSRDQSSTRSSIDSWSSSNKSITDIPSPQSLTDSPPGSTRLSRGDSAVFAPALILESPRRGMSTHDTHSPSPAKQIAKSKGSSSDSSKRSRVSDSPPSLLDTPLTDPFSLAVNEYSNPVGAADVALLNEWGLSSVWRDKKLPPPPPPTLKRR
ncbi:hypothetical protein BJ742DRAFT_777338 [Cladochytrium replicatum]|nr:hypothetical protein BJ742DRAFT_777338 [Cladochytrium replicatum]